MKNKLPLSDRSVGSQWSAKRKHEFTVVLGSGQLLVFGFRLEFSMGLYTAEVMGKTKTYESLACIVDGDTLHCTPLSKVVVAPPMSHFQVKFSGQITSLAFSKDRLFAIVIMPASADAPSTYQISRVDVDPTTFVASPPVPFATFSGLYPRLPLVATDGLHWLSERGPETTIRTMGYNGSISALTQTCGTINFGYAMLRGDQARAVYYGPDKLAVFGDTTAAPLPVVSRLVTRVHEYTDAKVQALQRIVLTEPGQLYWNDQLLAENVTSMACNDAFLLFTSMTQGLFDMLHLFELKDLGKVRGAVRLKLSRWPSCRKHLRAKTTD